MLLLLEGGLLLFFVSIAPRVCSHGARNDKCETGDCLHESHRGVGDANAVRVPEREEKSHVPVAVSAET